MRAGEVDERLVREIINSGFAPERLAGQFFEENVDALFLLEEQGKGYSKTEKIDKRRSCYLSRGI